MSLIDLAAQDERPWIKVGDCYAITRKPRGLDLGSSPAIPFVAMESVPQDGSYDPAVVLKARETIASGTYFERGDVLVAKITPSFENGKQALVRSLPQTFGYATTEVIPLRPLDRQHDPRLLFFYLLHPDVRHHVAERMEGSTGRQRVPEEVLLNLPMPAIPLKDQTRLADALELVQAAVAAENNCARTTRDLKLGTMRELFKRGIRGEVQKETDLGPLPASWNVVRFSEIREWLQYGTSVQCTLEEKRYPVLRIPNVEPGRVNALELKYCNLSDDKASKYVLYDGDLLFIRTNGVLERLGSCAVYSGEPSSALFASYLIRARLKQNANPRYVAYFYASPLGTSLVAGRATPAADGKYNLNTGTIDSLPLPLPTTIEEQHDIVTILRALDSKIALHHRKREVLEELFKSLLHKLMTGEIGVDDLDLSSLPATQKPEVAA